MFVFQFHYVETVLSFRMIEEGPKLMKVCFDFCKQILNKGKVPSPQNLRLFYGGGASRCHYTSFKYSYSATYTEEKYLWYFENNHL